MKTRLSAEQKHRDANGLRNVCGACGHPRIGTDPLVISAGGTRVHYSHYTDPATGFYGRPYTQDQS